MDYAAIDAEAARLAALAVEATGNSHSPKMRMSSSLLNSYGNPVYLTNLVVTNNGSITIAFDIAGGTNLVPYDILTTTNLANPISTWNWLGIGYTSNRYTFSSQPTAAAFYRLAKPGKTMAVAWGDNHANQCDLPYGLTNAVMLSGSFDRTLAVLSDGTIRSWGVNYPTNLTGVFMIASGLNHDLALLTNGTVKVWGNNLFGELNAPFPITNGMVVSAQGYNSLVLTSNGTVIAWGDNSYGVTNIPNGLTNVVAIACGGQHNLAVKADGTVAAWGSGAGTMPSDLTNVVDVAAGWAHSIALKRDGTVVCWGDNTYGESSVPAGLSNVVMIAAGGYFYNGYCMALNKDGTLVVWGNGQVNIPIGGLNHVIGISGGSDSGLVLRTGPPTPVITLEPVDQFQVSGGNAIFTAKGQGLYGVTYQWQTNGVNLAGATNATLTLANVQLAQQGSYRALITDNAGNGTIASSNASLTLVSPPVILAQSPMPTNQLAPYQTNLVLNAVAAAPGMTNGFPISYQWQFNGTNILGANTNSYSFLVDTPLLGNYSVIASNLAGSATSLVWNVTMTYVGSYIAPGTLAYHLSTNTAAHTNGISDIYHAQFPLAKWTYASYTGTNLALLTNAVWSTNFWLKGIQGLSATCIGFSNGLGGQGLVTMVSPRHYLMASHVGLAGLIAFLDTNNLIHWRTTVQRTDLGNDTSVGILNADLPPIVGYLPVMPTNFPDYIPTNSPIVQGIRMNQDIRTVGQPMSFGSAGQVAWNVNTFAPFGLSTNWNVVMHSGDSSAPEMFLVGNQLVLISVNSGPESGYNFSTEVNLINSKMHFLSTNNIVGSDYQMSPIDLAPWPKIQ